jgi:signal peptidase II|tara:strand:- start:675 stop:1148 length:474 start_codon:yes stop_codon:yes gene_type:complete
MIHQWKMIFFLAAVLVTIADQLTKIWVQSYAEGYTIFRTEFFQFAHSRNTGAAFGLFQDHSFVLAIVALFAAFTILLFTLFFWHQLSIFGNTLGRTALGLMLGGTIGNLIDRLRFGSVTDFIDFRVWPSFNVADAAITVGAILFAYSLIFSTRAEKH